MVTKNGRVLTKTSVGMFCSGRRPYHTVICTGIDNTLTAGSAGAVITVPISNIA